MICKEIVWGPRQWADSSCSVLLAHMRARVSAALFATSTDKLLVVPASRAPAWALKLEAPANAANALRAAGCVVESALPANHAAPLPPLSDAVLEAAVAAPGFMDLVASMQTALARRQSAGLPDLLLA